MGLRGPIARAALAADTANQPLTVGDIPAEIVGDAARAEYVRLLSSLPAGRVGRADLALVAAYCHYFSLWRRAVDNAEREGEVVVVRDDKGVVKIVGQSPWLTVAANCYDRWSKAASELGLSPASRARSGVGASGKGAAPSKAAQLIAIRRGGA